MGCIDIEVIGPVSNEPGRVRGNETKSGKVTSEIDERLIRAKREVLTVILGVVVHAVGADNKRSDVRSLRHFDQVW